MQATLVATPAAVAATRPTSDEAIVAAPFGDQPCEVEHGPSAALGAIRRKLVIVLVKHAEGVKRDHCPSAGAAPSGVT